MGFPIDTETQKIQTEAAERNTSPVNNYLYEDSYFGHSVSVRVIPLIPFHVR